MSESSPEARAILTKFRWAAGDVPLVQLLPTERSRLVTRGRHGSLLAGFVPVRQAAALVEADRDLLPRIYLSRLRRIPQRLLVGVENSPVSERGQSLRQSTTGSSAEIGRGLDRSWRHSRDRCITTCCSPTRLSFSLHRYEQWHHYKRSRRSAQRRV